MKKLFILLLLFAFVSLITPSVEAKIWTKDLVDKVTLDSGYKFSLCTVDMKYDINAAKNTAFLTVPEKDFEANLDAYKCNKYSQEDILFANITLHFNQTNWGGRTAHEKIIQFQNKLYSVGNYGSIFNPDFVDSKKAYADLGGVDWFSSTPGLHGIRGGNLIETDPSAKGAFLPNSTFLVIHNPSTGEFTSALFVINNVVYKLSSIISKVTTEITLVDYKQNSLTTQSSNPSANNQTSDTSNWKTYTSRNIEKKYGFNYSIQYPTNWYVNSENPHNTSNVPSTLFSSSLVEDVLSRNTPCVGVYVTTAPSLENIIFTNDSTEIAPTPGTTSPLVPFYKVNSQENFSLNGLKGIKRFIKRYNETENTMQIFLDGGKNSFYLDSTSVYKFVSCPNTNEQTFNQIISTFKLD